MKNSTLAPRLVSVREAATILGIGQTKTYELITDRQLKTMTIGARRLVTLESIDALIDSASNDQAA
jgi:excisionase family DNA binding protein